MNTYYIYVNQSKSPLAQVITTSFDKVAKAYYKSGSQTITVKDESNNARVYTKPAKEHDR